MVVVCCGLCFFVVVVDGVGVVGYVGWCGCVDCLVCLVCVVRCVVYFEWRYCGFVFVGFWFVGG